MARHLLKLTWNRKGANALVMLEIFVSFLVVFAVVAVTVKLGSLYFLPLGFEAENLWNVGIRTGVPMFDGAPEGMGERVDHLARELEGFDAVDGVAVSTFEPYLSGQSVMTWGPEDGRLVDTEILRVSTNYHAVMGLELVAGRFFEPGDEALHWKPVVVSTELARDIFGEEDPVGRVVISRGEDEEIEQRVVGVVSTFRRSGEFQPPRNVLFEPTWPTGVIHFPRRHLQLRMAPGTPADFEETVIETFNRWRTCASATSATA